MSLRAEDCLRAGLKFCIWEEQILMKAKKQYGFTGTKSGEETAREKRNRKLARQAAADGMVLLKNNGVLPIRTDCRIALFGTGATHMVKGGTGSGDVNERSCVSPYEGLKAAGYTLTSEAWIADYQKEYDDSFQAYLRHLQGIIDAQGGNIQEAVMQILEQVFHYPKGRPIVAEDLRDADTAVYIVSRIAGEGADRFDQPGEYQLSAEEEAHLKMLSESPCKLVVVLNAGSPLDTSFLDRYQVDALIQMSQPGMEGGNAFADVLSGKVNPSAKLTDTWAKQYADYPNASCFSHNNGNVDKEEYVEGIYVGYRYFDTFGVAPAFPFGYGLSYTTFALEGKKVIVEDQDGENIRIRVCVNVTNTGKVPGREVVQVYGACPQGNLKKEYKRLCGFAKSPMLAPGETQTVEVNFPLYQLTSFDESRSAYVLEAGEYALAIGNSSAEVVPMTVLELEKSVDLVQTKHICPLQQELKEIEPAEVAAFPIGEVKRIVLNPEKLQTRVVSYDYTEKIDPRKAEAEALADQMTPEQLMHFCCGEYGGTTGADGIFGAAGKLVPGAAGQTSNAGLSMGIPEMIVADGPAGLRLKQSYQVKNGEIQAGNPMVAINAMLRYLIPDEPVEEGTETYYQYCTAFPVGTALAQSWDVKLVERIGAAVAEEMNEMRISLWLAPGMNIHRNPLCGRNFEYYSEDPVVSGRMAAAMTRGVQSLGGTGTTIKHYLCNNQEDNRMASDTIISERALREIYLHNFEIAVRECQPMSIMSSYNLINGVHAANCYDTLTSALRDEWGFHGMVMTDWTTTNPIYPNCSEPAICMQAGNDLIMPGAEADIERIAKGVEDGTITMEDVKRCAVNVIDLILRSNCFEEAEPYV